MKSASKGSICRKIIDISIRRTQIYVTVHKLNMQRLNEALMEDPDFTRCDDVLDILPVLCDHDAHGSRLCLPS